MELYSKIDTELKDYISRTYGESFIFLHYTGNMYGMGCFIDDQQSLQKIRQLKQRSDNKGFIVLIPDLLNSKPHSNQQDVVNLDWNIHPLQQILMEQYWPGNLTFCLKLPPKSEPVFQSLAISDKIAIRCPENRQLREFIKLFGKPIISTSINRAEEKPLNDLKKIEELDWFAFGIINNKLPKPSPKKSYSTVIGFDTEQIECYREGSIPFSEIKKSYYNPQILFICTGNICRSPLAEYYANNLFANRHLPFRTASAGIFASNNKISSYSGLLLSDDNIDSSKHRAQQINKRLIEQSWLVLTMEELHKVILLKMFPDMQHRIFTLAEYCKKEKNISDPFTYDMDVYDDTYTQIKEYVDILTDILEARLASRQLT